MKKSAIANESRIFRGADNKYYEQIGTEKTEIEVPFNIPKTWRWCRLHTIFILNMGQSPDGSSLCGDGVEFHQGKICFGDKYIDKSYVCTTTPTKIVASNTILMCVRVPVGVVNITNREICIGRGLCGLINISDILDVNYWYYALSTYKQYYEDKATGSTFTAISSNIISETLVPLPPLEEQYRIVERIELIISKLRSKNHDKILQQRQLCRQIYCYCNTFIVYLQPKRLELWI